jgi:hypothetical protein
VFIGWSNELDITEFRSVLYSAPMHASWNALVSLMQALKGFMGAAIPAAAFQPHVLIGCAHLIGTCPRSQA